MVASPSQRLGVLGLIAGLLVACSSVVPEEVVFPSLEGTPWILSTHRGRPPVPGTVITATFESGQVRGSAGCNSYSGSYSLRGDSLQIDDLAWTLMACSDPEGVMAQERQVMESLGDARTYRVGDGRLEVFLSDGEALTFVPAD
jgi:heat shock protein HslJ